LIEKEEMDFYRKVDSASYSETMPTYPARVLTAHCAMKGLQAGAIGGLAIMPVYKVMTKQPLSVAWGRCLPPPTIGGMALSLGFLGYKHFQGDLDIAGVDDRAYRIAKSEGQTRVDKYSMVGGLVGASVGALFGKLRVGNIISASATGIAVGVAYYLVEKSL
jgi:hypothetical protein